MTSERMARWQTRQGILQAILRAHGAIDHDFRVDLGLGRFWWQDPRTGQPSVVAKTRVLCSWARSNGSLLAAWENRSLPESAAVRPVPGVEPRLSGLSENEAWDHALAIADGAKAEFVYRAPNAQMLIFLGLWQVASAGPEEAPFEPGPPWQHTRAVLDALAGMTDGEQLRVLARNYGQSWVEDHVRKGTRWQKQLQSLGERLVILSTSRDDAAVRDGIDALRAEVARLES